jgi:hypothetical protein
MAIYHLLRANPSLDWGYHLGSYVCQVLPVLHVSQLIRQVG